MNYQKKLEEELKGLEGRPRLLLHDCCAPCASYVLEYLSEYFDLTLFFFNPNITPEAEYKKRYNELLRLISEMPLKGTVTATEGEYQPSRFYEMAKGLENLTEGGKRCYSCYRLRLFEAAEFAKKGGFDYFTTTLSISPHKNAEWLNELGEEAEGLFGVKYLHADFKKNNGYKRSIELSRQYGLYRQDYCGCEFSKAAREREKEAKNGASD